MLYLCGAGVVSIYVWAMPFLVVVSRGVWGRGRILLVVDAPITVVVVMIYTIVFYVTNFILNSIVERGTGRGRVKSTARRTAGVVGSTLRRTRRAGGTDLVRTGSRVRGLHSSTSGRVHREQDRIRGRRGHLGRERRCLSGETSSVRTGGRSLDRGLGSTSSGLLRVSDVGGDRFSVLRGVSNFARRRTGRRLLTSLRRRLSARGDEGVLRCRRVIHSRDSILTGRVVTATVRHYTTSRATRAAISIISLPDSSVGNEVVNHRNHGVHSVRAVANIRLVVSSAPRTVAMDSFSPMEERVTELALRHLVRSNHVRPAGVRRVFRGSAHRIGTVVGRRNRGTILTTGYKPIRPRLIGLLNGLECHASCNRGILGRDLRISCVTNLVTTRLNTGRGLTHETNLLRSVNGTLSRRVRNSRVTLNIRCTHGCGRDRRIVRTVRTRRNSIRYGAVITYLIRTTSTISTTEPNTEHRGVRGCVGHLRRLRRVSADFPNIRETCTVRTNERVHIVISPRTIGSREVPCVTRRVTGGVRDRVRCPNRVGIGVVHRSEISTITGWSGLVCGGNDRGSLPLFFQRPTIYTKRGLSGKFSV